MKADSREQRWVENWASLSAEPLDAEWERVKVLTTAATSAVLWVAVMAVWRVEMLVLFWALVTAGKLGGQSVVWKDSLRDGGRAVERDKWMVAMKGLKTAKTMGGRRAGQWVAMKGFQQAVWMASKKVALLVATKAGNLVEAMAVGMVVCLVATKDAKKDVTSDVTSDVTLAVSLVALMASLMALAMAAQMAKKMESMSVASSAALLVVRMGFALALTMDEWRVVSMVDLRAAR